jgi:hypothetical protein
MPDELLHTRCEMFYAPLVVPDLLALLFNGTLELIRSSVAVIGSSFA